MSKWKTVRLDAVGKVVTGNTPPTKNIEFYNSNDIPFYKPNDIFDNEITDLTNSTVYVSEIAKPKCRILPAKSVLTTCIGTIGKVGVSTCECTCNQQINAIIPNNQLCDYKYLAYAIWNKKELMNNMANAPVVPIINKTQFSSIEIPLPPLDEQRKIAATLDIAADLLKLRKQQLTELDKLIQSVFYDMFGDPVTNEKGWEVKQLNELYNIIDGDRGVNYPKQEEFYVNGYCLFLNTGNVTKTGFNFSNVQFISEEKDSILKKGKLQRYDIVLTTRGTVGNLAYYDDSIPFENLRINSGMVLLRKKVDIDSHFFITYFRNPIIYKKLMSGTAQPQLPICNMRLASVIYPPMFLQEKFASAVQKINEQKVLIQQSINETQMLLNSLMSEYFK